MIKFTRAAVIGALYCAMTLIFAPVSFGAIQFRISEALCVLPFLMPEAVPGLFIGCLVSNILYSNILDIVFGSLATLLAAYLTSKIKNKYLSPLPAISVNAVVIGAIIAYSFSKEAFMQSFLLNICTVGTGEAVVCYALGIPLLLLFEKNKFLKKVYRQ